MHGLEAALLLICLLLLARRLTGRDELIRYRRMLGLFAFFYACLHFTTYIWVDRFLDLAGMIKDIHERPFITVGFRAFL